jgi:hypothetical protein
VGYTHDWELPDDYSLAETAKTAKLFKRALPTIKKILKEYTSIIQLDSGCPKPPKVTREQIMFNGKGDDGHETFLFKPSGGWEFCKTARKPYDMVVCMVLLVLKAYMPRLKLGSDGFCGSLADQSNGVVFDENWNKAMLEVAKYGVKCKGVIIKERPPYCDLDILVESILEHA